jgi:oligopeptidase A
MIVPSGNPLTGNFGLPKFDSIRAEHVEPAIQQVVKEITEKFKKLESSFIASWEGLVEPLADLSMAIHSAWSPVTHLNSVRNSPELRVAYEQAQSLVVDLSLMMQQSRPIYTGFKAIRSSEKWQGLHRAQQRIIDARILEAELNGIGLADAARNRFNVIAKELSEIETVFQNNVLDSTKSFSLLLKNRDEISGLPDSFLQLTAQSYNVANPTAMPQSTAENGPWLITLDAPCFLPLIENCKRGDIREIVYRAYVTRASEGSQDNQVNILKILRLRREKARLLGFANYAELSLSRKMAKSVDEVYKLEEELRSVSWERAQGELDDLRSFARSLGHDEPLQVWDIAFWAKRLQEQKFQFTEEELRPYFSFPRVLDGLFSLVNRLFGIKVQAADGKAPVWNKDVRYFEVFDADAKKIAAFYLDPYSRPENKRGGAWMDDCLVRRLDKTGLVLPVAHLVCNMTPPIDKKPSLMTFAEVETLFHEFGHGLQHILTRVDYADASGINGIEWDAVELPSQFMENWCYHRATVMGMAIHVDTGKLLPDELFAKICAAKTFRAAAHMLRQIYFGLVDIELHAEFDPDGSETIFDVQRRIAKSTTVIPPLKEDRFLCSFSHIFAGGYAAGYYSYKWAEVLSADAFSAFEEVGLDNEVAIAAIGRKFRDTILSLGGGEHPSTVFQQFRGRAPDTVPLLRHHGLLRAGS